MTEPDLTQSKRILSFDRRSSFSSFLGPAHTSPRAVRLITAQLLFTLSRTSLIAYGPNRGFSFSIKRAQGLMGRK